MAHLTLAPVILAALLAAIGLALALQTERPAARRVGIGLLAAAALLAAAPMLMT